MIICTADTKRAGTRHVKFNGLLDGIIQKHEEMDRKQFVHKFMGKSKIKA